MKRKTSVFAGVALAVILIATIAFGADMVMGNWKLNLAKSKYSPALTTTRVTISKDGKTRTPSQARTLKGRP